MWGNDDEENKEEEDSNEETMMSVAIAVTLAIISLASAIYSFASCNRAIAELNDANNDYGNLIDHWTALPIQDIELIASNLECSTLGSGWESSVDNHANDELFRRTDWEGTDTWCDCRPDGNEYKYWEYRCDCSSNDDSSYEKNWGQNNQCAGNAPSSCYTDSRVTSKEYFPHEGKCEGNALTAGCREDPKKDPVELTNWKGKKICIKRGGTSSMHRKKISSGGDCGSGWVKCGATSATYTNGYAICAESADECPVTSVSSLHTAATTNTQVTLGTGANGAVATGFPLVEVWITMEDPCYEGEEGHKIVTGETQRSDRLRQKYDVGCSWVDDRFEMWDSQDEDDYYQTKVSGSTTNNFYNIQDGGSVVLPTASGGSGQAAWSNLGMTTPLIQYDVASFVTWKVNFRREIKWDENCVLGVKDDKIEGHENDVDTIEGYQRTLLTLNGIFGLGFAIIYCCFVCVHACDDNYDSEWLPGHGKEEQVNLDIMSSCVTCVAVTIRFIPLILCLGLSGKLSSFAEDAQNATCSDAITNHIIQSTGEQLEKVYNANVNVLIFDILGLLMILLPICYRYFCGGDEEEDAEKLEEEDGGDDTEEPEENIEMETPAYAEAPVGGPSAGGYGAPPPQYNYGTPAPYQG